MAVTRQPQDLRRTPMDEAVRPLPMPEITPPDTRTYFMGGWLGEGEGEEWLSSKTSIVILQSVRFGIKSFVKL